MKGTHANRGYLFFSAGKKGMMEGEFLKKIFRFLKNQGTVSIAIIAAIVMIIFSLFCFKGQVNHYIEGDMRLQMEAIQKNGTRLVQNEVHYLKRLTVASAQLMNQAEISNDEDIIRILEDYAENSNIARALFVTLDGKVYTSYAGYLGQDNNNRSLDGIPLSKIEQAMISNPIYSEELGEVIFGVVSPAVMGEQKGVLVSSYNITQLQALLENEFIGGSVEIGILNDRGEVIIGKDVSEFHINIFEGLSQVQFSRSSAEKMKADFANGSSGFSTYSVEGIVRYCSYAPVLLNDWYVIVIVKESSLKSSLVHLEQYGMQLAVELVLIMIGLFTVIIFARYKEQQKIHAVLRKAAMIDGLTGIYNRITSEEEITAILNRRHDGSEYAMLIIDIDDFKAINDTCGHVFGDCVIQACALRLKENFGGNDIVGRIGGDEFVVLTEDGLDTGRLQKKIHAFTKDFCVRRDTKTYEKISVSVGIARSQNTGDTFMELYQSADAALYRAKQQGKGRTSV